MLGLEWHWRQLKDIWLARKARRWQEGFVAKLIVATEHGDQLAAIGGVPYAPMGTAWPNCSSCKSPMQFLARLPLKSLEIPTSNRNGDVLLLFQCQADPGMCDEWDPNLGGNAALIVPGCPAERLQAPAGRTLLPGRSPVRFEDYDSSTAIETSDDNYCEAIDKRGTEVLGKVGGDPVWLQGDETPCCSCGTEMRFFAQLEAWGGGGINFGDSGAGVSAGLGA